MNRKNQLCCWVSCALALLACSGPVSASPVGLTIEGTVSGTLVLSPGPVYGPVPPYTLFPVPPGTPRI